MYIMKTGKELTEILGALGEKVRKGDANANEQKLHKKIKKTVGLLSENPKHPGLSSHKIQGVKTRDGRDIWESYVENRTPGARRIFWYYGPGAQEITLLWLELHPDGSFSYQQVALKS